MESEQATNIYSGMKKRYPNRKLIPLLKDLIMMILHVLKSTKEVKFNLFMILLVKVLNEEKNLMTFGIGLNVL